MNDVLQHAAAEWLVRRNGGLTPAEEAEFAAWLARDPRHAAAYAAVEKTWSVLNAPRRAGHADAAWHEIDRLRALRARRRRTVAGAWGAAAMLVLGFGLLLRERFASPPSSALAPAHAAAVVALDRPTIRTLADGSKVALRPGAEIAVEFTADRRGVRLLRGEALFTVAKDAARPFVVAAGATEVRAVGTEFLVARGSQDVTVFVTEGRIAVANAAVDPAPRFAAAGERVTASAAAAPAVAPATSAELASALAWRGTRLEFSATPLGEAVHQFNRAGGLQLVLADAAIARRRLTGVFWADDAEGLVRLLETGFDLVAEHTDGVVYLRARR